MAVRRFRYDKDVDQVVEVTDETAPQSMFPGLGAYRGDKPLISQGLGCTRRQVPEMREAVKAAGLSAVDVLDDGRVAITSRGSAGRRGLLRLNQLHDCDGGYGDG